VRFGHHLAALDCLGVVDRFVAFLVAGVLLLLVNDLAAGLHDRVALLLRGAVFGRLAAPDVAVAGGPAARGMAGVRECCCQQHRDNRHAQ
jgi:hypothetical protein